ncbi:hypothetical protein SHKM778_18920 [Streptomyces sp. KM77-8]|uniref:Uncharacterized protein n=1 Tax=Streptomyces haneummycinicus TaxID=3074435 RepID=A0AAT9HDT1_9ACTN
MLPKIPGNPPGKSCGFSRCDGQRSLMGASAGKGCGDCVQVGLDPSLQTACAFAQLVHVQPGRMINEYARRLRVDLGTPAECIGEPAPRLSSRSSAGDGTSQ